MNVTVLPPTIDIEANNSDGPITVSWNSNVTLSWTPANSSSCTASGDWSGGKDASTGTHSQSTGNLTNPVTYNYTLTCFGNGSTSDTVQVIVNNPVPNDPANVTVTPPDYCISGPAATIGWTYSDPSGSPQSAYEVEIDDQGSFGSPEVDSGKVNSGSTAYFTGQGYLQFNTTYKARVRVWNSYGQVSGWTESGSFKTPNFAYPQVNFTWSPPNPGKGSPVQFTDQTIFSPQSNSNNHEWGWMFGDGGTSTQQNPSYAYNSEGTFYVTITATDSQNQSCSRTRGPLIIQKPIPKWREVAPQ